MFGILFQIVLALTSETAVDSAEVHFAAQNHAAVVRVLEAREPLRTRQSVLLGWSYYQLGQMSKARDVFHAAAVLAPDDLDCINGRAFADYRLGNAAAAEEGFRRVLQRDPERLESLRGLAFVLFTTRQFADCLPLFERILQQQPDSREIEMQLVTSVDGMLLEWKNQARTHASMVEEAWRLAAQGHRRSAVEIFRWILEDEPFHPGARLGIGSIGREFGHEEQALVSLTSLLRENSSDVDARHALAKLHLDADRLDEARKQIRVLREQAPDDPRIEALSREVQRRVGP